MAIRLTVLLFIPRRKSRLSPWYSVWLAKLRSAITGPLCIFTCDVTINNYLLTDFAIKSAIFCDLERFRPQQQARRWDGTPSK